MAEDRTRQTTAKLHTAGPNIPDRDIRLDQLPRSLWLGTSWSKESDADLSGVERVEGGGYGEPNRDGPGSTKMCRYGESGVIYGHVPCYRWDTAPLRDGRFIRDALRLSGVRFDGNPNSRYNEYICHTKVLLCQ